MPTSTAPTTPTTPAAPARVVDAVTALHAGVDGLAGLDVDTLDEAGITQVLVGAERTIRRLQALQARLAHTLSHRRACAARTQHPDDPRAAQRAARAVRSQLTDQLGITPSKAKRLTRTGAQLAHLPATAHACADGTITAAHACVIDEVTAHFHGDTRTQFETELVALAGRCRDAVEFGRQARGRLIARDHDAAMDDLARTKARRSGRATQTATGTTLLRLETAGYEGELVHTVIDAFRTPDAAGEHRTAEQRTHDAIMAAFDTALRTGAAATQHGVRPHVALIVRADSIRPRDGAAQTTWTGPLPYAEIARLLDDCALARIITDTHDVPLSVSRQVRTVPMGLWRLLVHRDGGCIVDGCDAPAGWCQVAHLDDPYAAGGRLTPETAGLLCTTGTNHHARVDNGNNHPVTWHDGRPTIHLDTHPRRTRPHPDTADTAKTAKTAEARDVANSAEPADAADAADADATEPTVETRNVAEAPGTDEAPGQSGLFAREQPAHYASPPPSDHPADLPPPRRRRRHRTGPAAPRDGPADPAPRRLPTSPRSTTARTSPS